MLDVSKVLILTYINFMLARCLIPDLSVQMLDKRLIQRKRQDTLEMCKLFTAENDKLNKVSINKPELRRRRHKREIEIKPIDIEKETAKRVEKIVDRLYEDLEENGERVTYRQMTTETSTTLADTAFINKTMRRFDFAPAELLGPTSTTEAIEKLNDFIKLDSVDWPKRWKHGIVPYFIDSKTYDTHLADVIMKAFDYFEKATCIRLQRLKDRPTDKESLQNVEWLYITNPGGIRQCVHSNEQKSNKGVQMVVFGYDCMSLGEILHEVMHILGFSHEHTRPDRDRFVTILWNNIKPGYKKYFEIRSKDALLNIPYDYDSVLHYPPRAFSKNGQVTILSQPGARLGQREGLSNGDVEKVNVIYGNECVDRNRQYLLKTCPSVVRSNPTPPSVTSTEILEYFKDRLWPYGVVNYKLRDRMEFTAEERENINAVMRHIEKETCIQFRDISVGEEEDIYQPEEITDPGMPSSKENNKPNSDQIQISNEIDEPQPDQTPDAVDNDKAPSSENDKIPAGQQSAPVSNENDEALSEQSVKASSEQSVKVSSEDDKTPPPIPQETDQDGDGDIKVVTSDGTNKNSDLDQEKKDTSEENEQKKSGQASDLLEEVQSSDPGNKVPKKSDAENEIIPNNSDPAKKKLIFVMMNRTRVNLNKGKNSGVTSKKTRRNSKHRDSPKKPTKSQRRHASNILVLAKSVEPGCVCPSPGKPGGDKVLYINSDCFNSVNDLLHLFVHLLGLDHQHNMHDRDSYLHIVWDNLSPDISEEMKVKLPPAASVGFDYDYQSVMHYPWLQIKNGVTNMMYPIWNDGWAMGHWQGLSSTDVLKLNILYYEQCLERKKSQTAT